MLWVPLLHRGSCPTRGFDALSSWAGVEQPLAAGEPAAGPEHPCCLYPSQPPSMLEDGPVSNNPLLSWVVDYWPSTSRLQEKGRRSVKSVTTFQDLMWCWYPRFVAGYKSYLDLEWLRERRRSRYVIVWNKSWSVIFHLLKFPKLSACFW